MSVDYSSGCTAIVLLECLCMAFCAFFERASEHERAWKA